MTVTETAVTSFFVTAKNSHRTVAKPYLYDFPIPLSLTVTRIICDCQWQSQILDLWLSMTVTKGAICDCQWQSQNPNFVTAINSHKRVTITFITYGICDCFWQSQLLVCDCSKQSQVSDDYSNLWLFLTVTNVEKNNKKILKTQFLFALQSNYFPQWILNAIQSIFSMHSYCIPINFTIHIHYSTIQLYYSSLKAKKVSLKIKRQGNWLEAPYFVTLLKCTFSNLIIPLCHNHSCYKYHNPSLQHHP